MLKQFLKLWLHFSKLYTQNNKTHTQHTKRHTHLGKANTSLKTVLTFLKKNIFAYINSTHKHKIISHIHAQLHTDVKNVKHYSRVSFACVEFRLQWSSGVCHSTRTYYDMLYMHIYTVYTVCMTDEFDTVMQLN